MTPELFNAAAAAARARCVIAGIELPAEEAEPPHPAFTGFRRVTYLWMEGPASYPIGDKLSQWLEFLRQRQVSAASLAAGSNGEGAVHCVHVAGSDSWRAADLEGSPLLRGQPSATEEEHAHAFAQADAAALAAAGADLGSAALAAAASASAVQRESLLRAAAILDSPGDGAEVSDVAWPYFFLPQRAYPAAAHRLLAAAAAAWPLPQAMPAIATAVNARLLAPS